MRISTPPLLLVRGRIPSRRWLVGVGLALASVGCEPAAPPNTAAEAANAMPTAAPAEVPVAPADAAPAPEVPAAAPAAPAAVAAPEMNPQALSLYNQGVASFEAADLAGALQAFSAATKADPTAYKAYHSLGAMYERTGNTTQARVAYQQSYVIQPDFVDGIVAYARLSAETGSVTEAERVLTEKRSALPKSAALTAALAEVKSLNKDSAGAQQFAQEALKLDPSFAPAMVVIARDHYRARRLDLSLYALKAILDGFGEANPPRDKNNAEARLLRATIWLEQDQRVKAMEEYKRAMEIRPDLVIARLRYATYLLESGGASDAVPLLQKTLQYDAGNVAAHLSLGDAYRLTGDYAKARQEFDWVKQQNGNLAAVHYNIGLLLLFAPVLDGLTPRDQVDGAIASLNKFKELASKSEQGDVDELLKRASLKKAEIEALAAAANAGSSSPPPAGDGTAAPPVDGGVPPAPPPADGGMPPAPSGGSDGNGGG